MWDPLLAHLRAPAIAVDLPGRRYRPADLARVTRQDWVDAVVEDMAASALDDVLLVGHSSAGYVIPGVAARVPDRVRHLVFVAATVPAEGARPVDFLKPKLKELTLQTEQLQRDAAAGKTIGGLLPGERELVTDLEVVENPPRMGLEAPGPLFEPFTWAGTPSATALPRTYIRCLRDRVIPPDLATTMADAMGATILDIDAGHDVASEAPAELARLLDRFASE
jgi:pimeloyl-ACP methyl ester carboxylesterase